MTTYIFAIGGSGSRVLRALTMLLASGVQIEGDIIPIIIDPDTGNGDLQRTVMEMQLYESIHKQLTFNNQTHSKFFSTNITSLNNDGNFLLPIGNNTNQDFETFINLAGMSLENQAMMRMLFSNNNLDSNMSVGFKGNPNIGSVVLNQFTETNAWKTFEQRFTNNDKVFIISSIFGGTGASGFPLLLKSMRTSTQTALKNAHIGAVSLLPYFNLNKDGSSEIQADSFVTKMKAALNYYEANVTGNNTLDEMYYLGDTLSNKLYNNYDGGKAQINDAHIIEMLAALAFVDFNSKTLSNAQTRSTAFHEFALETAVPQGNITFDDFGAGTKVIILKPLTRMAIMNSYLNNTDVQHRVSQLWGKQLGDNFFGGEFYKAYDAFKKNNNGGLSGFEHWIDQMALNQKSFAPFSNDANLAKGDGLNKIIGYPPKYVFLSKKGYDLIDEILSKKVGKVNNEFDRPTYFMEIFHQAIEQILTNNLQIQ